MEISMYHSIPSYSLHVPCRRVQFYEHNSDVLPNNILSFLSLFSVFVGGGEGAAGELVHFLL